MHLQSGALVPVGRASYHERVAAATGPRWVHGMAETIRPMDTFGDFNSPKDFAGARTTWYFVRSGIARHGASVRFSIKI